MEFKVKFEDVLKNIYGVDLEDVDREIDDYYYDSVSCEEVNADEDILKQVSEHIKKYDSSKSEKISEDKLKEIANKVLAFAINTKNSDEHYCKVVQKYKDKIIEDFKIAEKELYESEFLFKAGIYENSYSFDLYVDIVGKDVIFEGELDALDVLLMVCQGDYELSDLKQFREDFGYTHEQRFLNAMSELKNFKRIFNRVDDIFVKEDISYLYGRIYNGDTDIDYSMFWNWTGTIDGDETMNI